MKKRIVLPIILVFAIVIHLVFIEKSVQAEETASYGEDTAAYGEETAGYGEESAGYGDEAAEDGSAKPFVPAISAEEAPTVISKDQPRSLDELIMWYDSSSCQECHMIDGDHSFSPDFNRKKETSERLAESISLEVETLSYQFLGPKKQYIPTVAINTKIRSAAGHRIPDG